MPSTRPVRFWGEWVQSAVGGLVHRAGFEGDGGGRANLAVVGQMVATKLGL